MTALGTLLDSGTEIEIAGVLFDMDGTLVDSVPAVEEAWRLWALEHRVPVPPPTMHGRTARAVVESSGLAPEHHERAERRLGEIESRPGQRLSSFPGAQALLAALPASRWGVVTSAARPVAIARWVAARLPEPLFRVTGDDVVRGKPDPEPFRTGARLLSKQAGSGIAVAVEDSVAGLSSAHAAGCLTIGVGPNETRPQLSPHAHVLLPSLESVRVRMEGGRLLMRV